MKISFALERLDAALLEKTKSAIEFAESWTGLSRRFFGTALAWAACGFLCVPCLAERSYSVAGAIALNTVIASWRFDKIIAESKIIKNSPEAYCLFWFRIAALGFEALVVALMSWAAWQEAVRGKPWEKDLCLVAAAVLIAAVLYVLGADSDETKKGERLRQTAERLREWIKAGVEIPVGALGKSALALACAAALSWSAIAQTAKVIALSDADAQAALELSRRRKALEEEQRTLDAKIAETYLETHCAVGTCFKDGWENGFAYSEDFKYIVPSSPRIHEWPWSPENRWDGNSIVSPAWRWQ